MCVEVVTFVIFQVSVNNAGDMGVVQNADEKEHLRQVWLSIDSDVLKTDGVKFMNGLGRWFSSCQVILVCLGLLVMCEGRG